MLTDSCGIYQTVISFMMNFIAVPLKSREAL